MNVLMLTESYPTPEHPGRGVFLKRQAEALAEQHDVTVCFPQPWLPGVDPRRLEPHAANLSPERGAADGRDTVRVIRPRYFYVPRHRGTRIRSLARLVQSELASRAYDIVHAHWISPAGAAAVRAAKIFGIPVVVTAHAGDVYRDLERPNLRAVARETLLSADIVISVARYFGEAFDRLGIPEAKLRFIPNGVGEVFRPAVDRAALCRRLGLPDGVPLFAYLGNLYPAKGPGIVLEAFARLNCDARLLIAGSGPMADAFHARAQELRIANRVLFRGWYSHDAMPDLLAAIDFFVLASEAEGNPVTVLESLCCGTPVLGSDIAAIAELVTPERNGLLFPPRDPPALAAAMTRAVSRTWPREEISEAACSAYSWRSVAERIGACYTDAAENFRSRFLYRP